MLRLLLFIAALLVPCVSYASDYTYRDGYYWRDGVAYERYQTRQYYNTCCGQRWYTAWAYRPVESVKYAGKADYKGGGLREKILALAAARDAYEGRIREMSAEHNADMELIQELGLSKNFYWEGYGQKLGMANPYRENFEDDAYQAPFANQGSTVYGYTSVGQVHKRYDIELGMNQAARLAERTLDLADHSSDNFNGLLNTLHSNDAETAQILAKAQALREAGTAIAAVTSSLSSVQPGGIHHHSW